MNEREFINKIGSLKEIKADAQWASSTRDEILGERKLFSVQGNFAGFVFRTQAFAATAALVLFGGVFLYSHLLVSSDQRLAEELEKLTKQNEVQMLSIALADLKGARAEMGQSFAESMVTKSEEEVVRIAKDMAPSLLEIEEKEEVIMGTLGVMIESDETSTSKEIASYLIADLEKRSLTEEDEALLEEAKEALEAGDHRDALRKVLRIGESQEEAEDN